MLIKKDEEPFFYKFLSIAKEIIRKNKRYTPVFYGDGFVTIWFFARIRLGGRKSA